MNKFMFKDSIPASKSILNRALIIQSHFPELKIRGDSLCDDVTYMKQALSRLGKDSFIDCGEGGTTLRFLTLRASRLSGNFFLKAHPRLMARPQNELVAVLKQLNIQAKLEVDGVRIASEGWKTPVLPIPVSSGESSQYASALLLNSWNLDFDLEFFLTGAKVSESYFNLTLQMVRDLGMQVLEKQGKFLIPAEQKIIQKSFDAESDLSSVFVFAAAGALFGQCDILNFPEASVQPDRAFVEIFRLMNIPIEYHGRTLTTSRAAQIKSVDFDISQAPDLFPVLAVLCSFADGVSRLYGAPHLAHKESNRIQKIAELFDLIGVQYEAKRDGMIIQGGHYPLRLQKLIYDTAHDHRMVMAAALLKKAGHNLTILYPESVQKSLPDFFDLFKELA